MQDSAEFQKQAAEGLAPDDPADRAVIYQEIDETVINGLACLLPISQLVASYAVAANISGLQPGSLPSAGARRELGDELAVHLCLSETGEEQMRANKLIPSSSPRQT